MKLYNSLTRKLEEFKPIVSGKAGVYTCGPTVYDYIHIGNWRTYVLGDLLVRTLTWNGFKIDYIMNITNVGHLTGDNAGDADTGEDRMEKAAEREGKTAWEIAKFYTQDFLAGYDKLNLIKPKQFTKATEHIAEQIELVKKIEAAGFTYKIEDGIYFDIQAYEAAGNTYGALSTLDQREAGARIEPNPDKKDRRDFALWKFSPSTALGAVVPKREMEWDSPWGVGFPGWHVECSAMSMGYLGEQFDIHIGGEDLRSTHHPNEIAQSEAATGKKPFVKYWLHGAHLLVEGGRMGKSLGNAYTLADLTKRGFEPLALRYFYLTGHYRKQLNFTFEALGAASEAYKKLRQVAGSWLGQKGRTSLSQEKLEKLQGLSLKFRQAVENDLNFPEALAVVWEMAKSNLPEQDKSELMTDWDQVLGLKLTEPPQKVKVPEEVEKLMAERERLRQAGDFSKADKLREEIEEKGFKVEDDKIKA